MDTLWFRFKGVPLNRNGGAWWHRVFSSSEERARFLHVVEPFLAAWAFDGEHGLGCGVDCVRRLSRPPRLCQVHTFNERETSREQAVSVAAEPCTGEVEDCQRSYGPNHRCRR